MSEAPPLPLVCSEVKLKGLSGFVLDINRLLASELVALGKPEGKWAAFMLWCRAWQQSPPGSLPNDEKLLAAFSGAGRQWGKVRETALRGFVLCSDGRLYHPVVCEQVMLAWKGRKAYLADQERLRKWREKRRGNENETPIETPDETRFNTHFGNASETPLKSIRNGGEGEEKLRGSPSSIDISPKPRARKHAHARPKFAGLEEFVTIQPESGKRVVKGWFLDTTARDVCDAAGFGDPADANVIKTVIQWLADGYDGNVIVETIQRISGRDNYVKPGSLTYFTRPIEAAHKS